MSKMSKTRMLCGKYRSKKLLLRDTTFDNATNSRVALDSPLPDEAGQRSTLKDLQWDPLVLPPLHCHKKKVKPVESSCCPKVTVGPPLTGISPSLLEPASIIAYIAQLPPEQNTDKMYWFLLVFHEESQKPTGPKGRPLRDRSPSLRKVSPL
uniref:RAD9-HUS1-RAD1 interacting nuclear orphan 1 n=2 Tax=Steinernema glaseri TaxID=37863 RepID=A0A1I7ZFB0_9BILA